jgi:hypothetical protein
VAVVVTYPLVRVLGTHVAGIPGDTGVFLWCVDVFWSNLREGLNPFFTRRIFYPIGVNLAASSCPMFLALLGEPFGSELPLFAGLLALASPIVAAIGAMLLADAVIDDLGAAAVAGLLYGFCPTLLSLLWGSQLAQVAAAAMMPFGILAVLRFWRTAGWSPLLAVTVLAWAMLLTQVYTTVAFVAYAAATSLVLVRPSGTRRHFRRLAVIVLLNVVIARVLFGWVYPPVDLTDLPRGGYGFTSRSVVNLADLLVPSDRNPLLGSLYRMWASDFFNREINSYFLGWMTFPLAVYAAVRGRRLPPVRALAIGGLVVLVLALGSAFRLGPIILVEGRWTPFEILHRLPVMEMLDAPRRFVVGVALAVAVLAGVGVSILRRRSARPRTVVAAALVVFALDYGQIGLPVTSLAVPAVYQTLATRPGDGTLLEIGGGLVYSAGSLGLDGILHPSHQMYWQTVHRKPRIGGYVARFPRSTYAQFRNAPILGEILLMAHAGKGSPPNVTYRPEDVTTFIRAYDLRWIIVPASKRQMEYAQAIDGILDGHVMSAECGPDGAFLYTVSEDAPPSVPPDRTA